MSTLTVYAGTAVNVTLSFKNPGGVLTDPDAVSLIYTVAGAEPVTLTYAGSGLTKLAVGVYFATLDTTDFAPGTVSLWAIGEGACEATYPGSFIVRAGPPAPPGEQP